MAFVALLSIGKHVSLKGNAFFSCKFVKVVFNPI